MNEQKYFSLIYGAQIQRTPNQKIIPGHALSELLSAQEVIERVQKEAAQYRQEVIHECELLKEQAQREGFEEGYKAWVQQLQSLETEIVKVRSDTQKIIMPIAIKAAKKIVASELQTAPDVIVNIVMQALKSVAQHKKIILYVNKVDIAALENNKGAIKELFEALESFSIQERDDVEQGGCIIETERGIIDSQIQNRWVKLKAALESLAGQILKGS